MRTWKNIALVLAAVGVAIGVVACYRYFQRHRDLVETLQWMDQTYNPHEGGENFGQGHGWQIHYLTDTKTHTEKETQRFQTTFTRRGNTCRMSIHSETFPIGIFEDMPGTRTYTFNLGDIDPRSITVKTYDMHKDGLSCADPEEVRAFQLDCSNAEVEFNSRNAATEILSESVQTFTKLQGKDHEARETSKTSRAWFIVDDIEYSKRFVKALTHAVELCGGRVSKF